MPKNSKKRTYSKPVQPDPVLRELYRQAARNLSNGETPELVLADFYYGTASLLGERLLTERELSTLLRRSIDFSRDRRTRRKLIDDWPPDIRFGTRGEPLYLWSDIVDWLRRIRNVAPGR